MKEDGKMKVSISVLGCYDNLEESVKKVNNTSANYLHVDVMDGKFVLNRKFPYEIVEIVKEISVKPLDVHLMVESIDTVKKYAELKPEILTFHIEIIKDDEIINYVKSLGIKVGLAINPETSISKIMPYVNSVDLILFMSVNPGLGGQSFKPEVLEKVKALKPYLKGDVVISIDGGINDKNVKVCKEAGCDMVVSGSFVTNSEDYEEKIKKLSIGKRTC